MKSDADTLMAMRFFKMKDGVLEANEEVIMIVSTFFFV